MKEEEVTVVPGWQAEVTLELAQVETGEEDEEEVWGHSGCDHKG